MLPVIREQAGLYEAVSIKSIERRNIARNAYKTVVLVKDHTFVASSVQGCEIELADV